LGAVLLVEVIQRAAQRTGALGGAHRLELKERGAGENGGINMKMRI
jgi:hypothetical protein